MKKEQKNNDLVKKDTKDDKKAKEIQSIIEAADRIKDEQLTISELGELTSEKEIRDYALGSAENPEKKYTIYYQGINKLLKRALLPGKESKKIRDLIYEEKNIYLTRGKFKNELGIRGGDGRMGYLKDSQDVFKAMVKCVRSNSSMVEIYQLLVDMNIKKGYKKPSDR